MKQFELTIFRQSRVLIAVILTPVALIGFLVLGGEFKSPIFTLLLFFVYLLTVYYFVIGHLMITIDKGQLKFRWKRKFIFNYQEIEPITIAEINTIVIDNGQFLRKLVTEQRTVKINTTKIQQKEALKFIAELRALTKGNKIRNIDSWDEIADKGYIKAAYRINTFVLLSGAILITYFIITRGYNSGYLFSGLLFLPQLFFYGKQMKHKIKNKNQLGN